jgi:hypothetical protein
MREYYGPMNKAFGALDEEGQNALERDLITLAERYDRSEGDATVLHSDYLEVVATRR